METQESSSSSLDLTLGPLQKELYFLIAKFLSAGPCKNASKELIKELQSNEILPDSINWLGETISQDYENVSSKFNHIDSTHLPKILEQFIQTQCKKELRGIHSNRSLLSHSTLSLLRNADGETNKRIRCIISKSARERSLNTVPSLNNRSIWGPGRETSLLQPSFYERLNLSCRTLGHLSAVYCVLFDMTGRFIITGADDSLVKIWSAVDGRLLATLRGAVGEITDLAVNKENTLLAVASSKLIRVWSLATCEQLACLSAHAGNVNSIFFCPMPKTSCDVKYLASTSNDGSCAFWEYNERASGKVVFHPKPTQYFERLRPGHAQMMCSSFSAGGVFMAAGSADNNVRVYYMLGPEGPERILEVECHSDGVDSISWAHEGLTFASGSKDGTAIVWRFENAEWHFIRLHVHKSSNFDSHIVDDPKKRPRVTMVGWNADDTLLLTAASDHLVKVWNPKTGDLVRTLQHHQEVSYVIEAHPTNPRLMCTAGHDGKTIIWDIGTLDLNETGSLIFEHVNDLEEGQGFGAVFDCKWAPDGLSLAATDSHGHLLIFTTDSPEHSKFKRLPKELFFHTDYRPVTRHEVTQEILDEQTQVPPHLMPPPFLVDMDGNPYPPALQRLVRGRERCQEDQLIPNVAIAPGGNREVIEGLDGARSNIDQMIEQLAIAQGVQEPHPGDEQGGGARNPPGGERRGLAVRRVGDVEGVRQSTGNWQPTNCGFMKKIVVPPLTSGVLKKSEELRRDLGEIEQKYFLEEIEKGPVIRGDEVSHGFPSDLTGGSEFRSRRIRQQALLAAERRREQARADSNRLAVEGVALPNPPQMEISIPQLEPRRLNPAGSRNNTGGGFRVGGRTSHHRSNAVPLNRRVQTLASSQSSNGSSNGNGANRRRRPVRFDVIRRMEERANEGLDVDNMDVSDSSDSTFNGETSDSSSSSSSDSESDWAMGTSSTTRTNEDPSSSQVSRTRRGKRNRNSSESQSPPPRTSRSRRESKPKVEEEEEEEPEEDNKNESEDEEVRPGPSSEILKKEPRASTSTVKTRPRRKTGKANYAENEEFQYSKYRPSEWLAETVPKKSPYFPQLGDTIMYFRQGHHRYIKEVEAKKPYEITKRMYKSLPWKVNPEFPAEFPARVVKVDFELAPTQLVVLKIMAVDENGEPIKANHLHYTVRYHDMPSIVDFIVLKQTYDRAISRNWNVGDKFRCLIDRYWWLGTVTTREDFEEEFPDSRFLCYKIHWENGETELMSPWDLEVVPDDFDKDAKDASGGIPATDEDFRVGLYEPTSEDWPYGYQEMECQRIVEKMEQVMTFAIAEAFLVPVDTNAYPDYVTIVEYQIDLSTIKSRLENLFYRRKEALIFDTDYIALNAERYNMSESDIVRNARVIRELLCKIINDHETDVNQAYQQISKAHKKRHEQELSKKRDHSSKQVKNKVSEPHSSRSSRNTRYSGLRTRVSKTNHRSMRSSRRIESTDDDEDEENEPESEAEDQRTWEEHCMELIETIWQCKDSVPFRAPVNAVEYPDYHALIDTPMDLQTIREDLSGGNYESLAAFDKDMKLVWSNSKQYNTDQKSRIHTMTVRMQALYDCQIAKIKKLFPAKPTSNRRVLPKRRTRTLSTRRSSVNNNTAYASSSTTSYSSPAKNLRNSHTNHNNNNTSSSVSRGGSSSHFSSSANSSSLLSPSPRKNPVRSAAKKNPYIHNDSDEDSDRETRSVRRPLRANNNNNTLSSQSNKKRAVRRRIMDSSSSPPRKRPCRGVDSSSRRNNNNYSVKLRAVAKKGGSEETDEETDEDESEEEVEDEEDEETTAVVNNEDDEQPGPSTRLVPPPLKKEGIARPRRAKLTKPVLQRMAEDDDEESDHVDPEDLGSSSGKEGESEEDEEASEAELDGGEDDDESVDNDGEEEDEDSEVDFQGRRMSGRVRKPKRFYGSEDEEYSVTTGRSSRSPGVKKKMKKETGVSYTRSTRRQTRQVGYYEENSDSAEESTNRMSSRGRVIRTRSFID